MSEHFTTSNSARPKNPALWIGTEEPNQIVKVASFSSKDKADTFCKWLEYLLGFSNDEQAVKRK